MGEILIFLMEISLSTSQTRFRSLVAILILFCYFIQFAHPVFATTSTTTSDTLVKTDILKVAMNMYSLARQWEEWTTTGYTQEAFLKFSDKLNKMIEDDSKLKASFKNLCSDCTPIISSWLDTDKDFLDYIKTSPGTKAATTNLGLIIARYFHPTIQEKVTPSLSFLQEFQTKATKVADNIRVQVKEQTAWYRDVSGMGLYYDGNTDNSPYDLLDDIRRIDEIFFREAPEFGDYKNTSSEDAAALITGKIGTGSWWGGENYNIDLASEIKDALGGSDSSSSGSSSWSDGELAGDCDSGFCITVDYIQNTHYFLGSGSGGKWKNSFQGIFEEGLDWIIKNGDNRNFACKVSPTINTWESEFDLNILLKNVFSGASVFVFWKTPPFLKGFFDRNSKKSTSTSSSNTSTTTSSNTKTKEEQETLDSLKAAFRRYDMDFDKPTNIKASQWQTLKNFAITRASNDVRVLDTVNAINQAKDDHEQLGAAAGKWFEKAKTQEKSTESIKHMEKAFDDTGSRTRMLYELVKMLKVILDYLWDKEKCQWS